VDWQLCPVGAFIITRAKAMSMSLLNHLLTPVKQFAGKSYKSEKEAVSLSPAVKNSENNRCRQNALNTAAFLINRLEKEDFAPTISELHRLSPEERVSVAEKMLWLNKQHRSIITSLPRFNCSFFTTSDGCKNLSSVEISHVGPEGVTSNTFTFIHDVCNFANIC